MRQCGECSLCCKVPRIPELHKVAGKWCQHCKPGSGCTIYESRPPVCSDFYCEWLVDSRFGDEWKPTKSKLFLRMVRVRGELLLVVNVDPGFPGAWRKSPYYEQFKTFSRYFAIEVSVGERRYAILPTDDVEFRDDEMVIRTAGGHLVVPAEDAAQTLKAINGAI